MISYSAKVDSLIHGYHWKALTKLLKRSQVFLNTGLDDCTNNSHTLQFCDISSVSLKTLEVVTTLFCTFETFTS